MRLTLALFLSVLLVMALAPAGGALDEGCRSVDFEETPGDTTDDVELCRSQVWIHEGASKVGNLDQNDGVYPSWDTTPPSASVTGGAGGGYAGSSLHQLSGAWDPAYTPAFEGSFDGAMDNMIVQMHLFPLVHMAEQETEAPDAELAVDANLYVDGTLVASHGGLAVEAETAGDAVRVVTFVFAEFYAAAKTGAGAHDIRLELVGTGLAGDAAVWVYDTTEVPSNLIINATPEEYDGLPGAPVAWPF